MYTCINTYNVLARVIWPATFARSARPPGGQNGRTDIYRKIIAAVRLGGLAPARPNTRRMLSIVGERELRLHSESHVLRCTVNDLY